MIINIIIIKLFSIYQTRKKTREKQIGMRVRMIRKKIKKLIFQLVAKTNFNIKTIKF